MSLNFNVIEIEKLGETDIMFRKEINDYADVMKSIKHL